MVAVVGRCLVGARTVKVTVRLAGSCRRVEGVDGHLEQRVGSLGFCSSYKHFTNLEGSFPNKTPVNPTLCSRWPSTPPTLLHDPASRTVTFTVLAPTRQCPTTATNHIQQNQVCSQLHTKSPPPIPTCPSPAYFP